MATESTAEEGVAPASDEAEWTILYHGPLKFKGRAEFLRLMLEDAGVRYANSADKLYGPTGRMDAFRGSAQNVAATDDVPFPTYFPPAIWHRPAGGDEVCVNQVAACVVYLGEQLGYAPSSAAERARADCITQNALDYISAGRLSFHPVQGTMSYSDQKEEGDRVSAEWAKDKMGLWLQHFEKIVKRNASPTSPVAGGAAITYADFVLFHVLEATLTQFNNEKYEMAWDKADIPGLKEFHSSMKARPNLTAYYASGPERCPPFAGDSMM